MRVVSEVVDAAVASTTSGDRLVVNAWRGGQVLAADLDVTSFGLRWSASQQIQGQASFTIADPDGMLTPVGLGDALAPGGSRLQVTWVWGDARVPAVPLGWWRIRRAKPAEQWRFYRPGGSEPRYGFGEGPFGIGPFGDVGAPQAETLDGVAAGALLVYSGGEVVVDADEETASIALARLDAEEVASSSSLDEVVRLLQSICGVTNPFGVPDRSIPPGLVYEESRIDAIEDHLDRLGAVHRMGGDGSLEIVPVGGVGPVWTIAGGDDGVLVELQRELSDDQLYNVAISTGETEDGGQLRGRYALPGGPLDPSGPFGSVPIYHRSPATTAEGVQADARTLLENRTAAGEVVMVITCLAHPGLQMHDVVTVAMPTTAGAQPLRGRVVGMALSSSTGTPSKSMSLEVAVSAEALEAVALRVRGVA
ncbi:MAG: hypothetical protein P1U38_09555 [Aeromicrobium sp.]|uniref:hypothetical protein n=1 Tax=Aeromicrobium sp. TaxID=1871063 RepID=UPI00261989E0|nr:hypothetical protein [Aeromicrobium sp.]MDF1705006.1 hypothetical protein [Aeromicrobium sp.]